MANRYAVKSGNWSDPTVWDGGLTLPGPDDVVRPNGFVVTVDQDVTVAELRNNASSPAVVGGYFSVVGSRTITAPIVRPGLNLAVIQVVTSNANLILNGNVSGSDSAGSAYAGGLLMQATGAVVVINGNVTGSDTHGEGYGMSVGNGTITINGDVRGGNASTTYGIVNTSNASNITILGTIRPGPGTNSYGIYSTQANSILDLQGPIYAINSTFGVYITASTNVRIRGPLYNAPNGRMAIVSPFFVLHASEQTFWQLTDDYDPVNGNPVLLANYVDNSPAPANVREGTVYGPASSLTGTMHIPAAADVANGVPVDNTVGTAVASPTDVWDHEVSTGVEARSRLLRTATPAVVAAQIASAVNDG